MYFKKIFTRTVATFSGLGYLPFSGTVASAVTALVWFMLPSVSAAAHLAIIASIALLGSYATHFYLKTHSEIDPREVVIDEVLGMLIALLWAPHSWPAFLTSFVLFRFFDIAKPFPINRCEQLPGAWGVLIDDVVAGILALAVRILALQML